MRRLSWSSCGSGLLILLLAGCDGGGSVDVTEADTDTDTDSDTDVDSDADADSDTDVDADTDADSDTDTEVSGPYDPEVAGPHGFDTAFATDGPLPARVFRTQAAGPAPVVVLMHGFQLEPDLYGSYGARLATRGFTVVLPQHGGSNHANLANQVSAVLDWIDTEPVDVGPVTDLRVMAGHSLGGKLVALKATTESRVDGLFLIDAVDSEPPFIGNPTDHPSVTPELMPQIDVPIVSLGETNNQSGLQPCAPAGQNFEQYFVHAESPAMKIDVLEASHMSFLDDPSCGLPCNACPNGPDDPAETRRITRASLVAFAEDLQGTPGARDWLVGAGLDAYATSGLVTVETANGF